MVQCAVLPSKHACMLIIPTHSCFTVLQVRQRLEAAKKRKEGGSSSAADFAPDGEQMGSCAAWHNRLALQA